MPSRSSRSFPRSALPRPQTQGAKALVPGVLAIALALLGAGCSSGGSGARVEQLLQRQEQMELQVQQLERRVNQLTPAAPGGGNSKAPAGVVKSLTYRSGTSDDRLRIYWADGSVSDLPCTKEQNTTACG